MIENDWTSAVAARCWSIRINNLLIALAKRCWLDCGEPVARYEVAEAHRRRISPEFQRFGRHLLSAYWFARNSTYEIDSKRSLMLRFSEPWG